jgi:hypothetical protein
MPYNYDEFEVIQVAFPRHSPVLARLKEEAARYKGKPVTGPHIFELLADRDAHIYGTAEGEGKGIWFPPSYQVQIVNETIPPVTKAEPADVVVESNVDDIDSQAASMAAAFADDDN